MKKRLLAIATKLIAMTTGLLLLSACESTKPYDNSALAAASLSSIVVLPPTNDSPEITATPGVWAQSTKPLAEAGYYVLPVTLVDQTFTQNGVHQPTDAHKVPRYKLLEVFGADAALYLNVKRYGTEFALLSSATEVEVQGRLVDLRTGQQLWDGNASASSAEGENSNESSLLGLLASALISQIIETATDASFSYAEKANDRLFTTKGDKGLLPGPRSPDYRKASGK